ncbi:DUF305 domain-containing protein [Micromonospora vulcania]|uniref:DUF305 domain-containing protein n=1 Tax=Micromonospora vulcania TaxID=1441873 RepID=A0ABW1H3Z0_9ACTN
MRASAIAVSTVFIAALLGAGCAADPPHATGTAAPLTTGPPAAGPSSLAAPTGTAGGFSPTDIAWLQLTVAQIERLLPVLDLVPARTTDPAWRRLTTQLEATHRADLDRARRLLAESGAPATNPHEGHDMPGMVTAEELSALRSATGKPFHRLLAGHLRANLTQSVRIATAEQKGGAHPRTTALATAVVRTGNAELARLDRIDQPPTAVPVAGHRR